MLVDVQHEPHAARFVARIEGMESVVDYRLVGGTMTITSTEVPPALRGQGVAAELVRTALQTARQRGWKVVPMCSYAARYIDRHAQFQDLLAQPARKPAAGAATGQGGPGAHS